MTILAISGSPIKNGNIDKTVQAILEAAGGGEFIKLSRYRVYPCLGCLQCADDNHCVQKDDYTQILEDKLRRADAIIIGGFPTFASLDARTKTLCERTYSLRHRTMQLKGKPSVVVAGGYKGNQAVEDWLNMFCKAQGMELVGSMQTCGHATCLLCGHDHDCPVSNVRPFYGEDAHPASCLKDFSQIPELQEKASQLGQALRNRLNRAQ